MRGPRCEKHLERHYMKNDCDKCKEKCISTLTARLREAEEIIDGLLNENHTCTNESHEGCPYCAVNVRGEKWLEQCAKHGKGA